MNWRDITYLRTGTARQREAHMCLLRSRVLETLEPFDPALVSTICVDVDIADSDLDIICSTSDLKYFEQFLLDNFGAASHFSLLKRKFKGEAVIASYRADDFEVEIFGSTIPTEQQEAYRHLNVLYRLIRLGGRELREKIRKLKKEGMKTEPAVAAHLCLSGDPHSAVLDLERMSDEALLSILERAKRHE